MNFAKELIEYKKKHPGDVYVDWKLGEMYTDKELLMYFREYKEDGGFKSWEEYVEDMEII